MSTKDKNKKVEAQKEKPTEVVKATLSSEMVFREAEVPEGTEEFNKTKGYMKYGKNNLHPQFLYQLVQDSPIHGGIIAQKIDFIFGDGVEVVGTLQSKNDIIQKNGASKHTLDEIVEDVITDNEVLYYYYLLFKRVNINSPWYVEILSGELVRPNDTLTLFQYSENWGARSQSYNKTNFKEYKSIFGIKLDEALECVMYVKAPSKQTLMDNGKLTSSVFPHQRYGGAIPSILADVEMNHFHYAESVNGWTSNTILQFMGGVPEPDKKRQLLKDIKDQTTDRKKKGGITVIFADGKERAMEVLNLNGNNNDTRYLLTQEHGFQTIMIAHQVQNPALFGLQVAGKLGRTSAVEALVDYKKFMATYASKRRKVITESIEFGLSMLNDWEGLQLEFKDFMPEWLLPEVEEEPEAETQPMTESEEQTMFALFSSKGTDRSSLTFVESRAFDYESTDGSFITDYTNEKFVDNLTEDQHRILQMINNGESYKAVVDALDKGAAFVSRHVIDLTRLGYVEEWKLTEKGVTGVATQEMITVVYTYEKRDDVDGPEILPDGRTRSFCETLIGLSRAYTREEINAISSAVNRDVWLYRGGWYHNPKTDANTPSCRHFWKQNIILS